MGNKQSKKNLDFIQSQNIRKIQKVKTIQTIDLIREINQEIDEEQDEKDQNQIGLFFYIFEIESNQQKWKIQKRFQDFIDLFNRIPKEEQQELKNPDYDCFLKQQEKIEFQQSYLNIFEQFLVQLNYNIITQHTEYFYQFLQISAFNYDFSNQRYLELYVQKRSGGRFHEYQLSYLKFGTLCKCWQKRYLIINSEGVIYTQNHLKNEIRENLLFDHHFQVKHKYKDTKIKRCIILCYSTRLLYIQAKTLFDFYNILLSLKQALKDSPYVNIQRFNSFAPIRYNSICKWLVDGQYFYKSIFDCIDKAEHEIYIQGWWLSPQLYLKRPVSQKLNQNTRLDKVLLKAAIRGVQVRIIVWYESKYFMFNDSEYTSNYLEKLHQNISVQRHPSYIFPTFLWSHHDKLVLVDQKIAFLGGFDLCYGRMDTSRHQLVDQQEPYFFPGIDYNNDRIKEFQNVRIHDQSNIDRQKFQRMPWHDVGVKVMGEAVKDLSRHFIQNWNFSKFDNNPGNKSFKDKYLHHQQRSKQKIENLFNFVKKNKSFATFIEKVRDQKQQIQYKVKKTFEDIKQKTKDELRQAKKFTQNHFMMTTIKRRNSGSKEATKFLQDEQIENQQNKNLKKRKSSLQNLQDENIDQIINQNNKLQSYYNNLKNRIENETENKSVQHDLQENKYDQQSQNNQSDYIGLVKKIKDTENDSEQYDTISDFDRSERGTKHRFSLASSLSNLKNRFKSKDPTLILQHQQQQDNFTCKCQVIRQASKWSLGLGINNTEQSIQLSYLQLISESQHYIYIENQFFISSLAGDFVKNQIGEAIIKRIQRAAENKQKFKIFIMLPLFPAFEGDIASQDSTVLKIQMTWQYKTIYKSPNSLLNRLIQDANIDDPFDYIQFYSLRQHEKMNDIPITNMIYVHSKIILIDDKIAIIGSANINDRSMNGDKDSEIGIVIEDSFFVQTKMNGQKYKASQFVYSLRKQLFQEHFGLNETQVIDPLNDENIQAMNQIANNNTELYRKIFGCYPDNQMKVMEDIKKFEEQADISLYDELWQIQAFAVQFPYLFLEKEDLIGSRRKKEFLVPSAFV